MSRKPPENQDKSPSKPKAEPSSTGKAVKQTRLKQALRDNLRRRKHKADPTTKS